MFTCFRLLIMCLTVLFFATFQSCKKTEQNPASSTQLDLKHVLYGIDTAQNMDVYLPAGRDTINTKWLLFVHGGSWASGDKNDFNETIGSIRGQLPDFAFFNINYRFALGGINIYPTQLNDVQAAIDFIRSKHNEYHINPNKIVVAGASAGAQLALLQAYKYNDLGYIKAVIDLFGPTDLNDLYYNHPVPQEAQFVLQNYLGTTPNINPLIYLQASPINYVTAQTVPTKIFHGTADEVVPIAQSLVLKAKLDLPGLPTT